MSYPNIPECLIRTKSIKIEQSKSVEKTSDRKIYKLPDDISTHRRNKFANAELMTLYFNPKHVGKTSRHCGYYDWWVVLGNKYAYCLSSPTGQFYLKIRKNIIEDAVVKRHNIFPEGSNEEMHNKIIEDFDKKITIKRTESKKKWKPENKKAEWYNNGTSHKKVKFGEPVPEGYVKGRIKKK